MCLISALWISASLLPCPWEIVLCPRKLVKGGGGNFYECVKNPNDELPRGHCLFCCILFLNMQDESSWIICNPHPLFFSKIFSLTEVFLAGRCLPMVPAMGISLCASSCTKNPQRGKGFSLLYQPSPLSVTSSAGFCLVSSLNWRQHLLWYALLSLYIFLSIAWAQLTQEKRERNSCVLFPAATCKGLFPSVCFGSTGKGGLGNYKAPQP